MSIHNLAQRKINVYSQKKKMSFKPKSLNKAQKLKQSPTQVWQMSEKNFGIWPRKIKIAEFQFWFSGACSLTSSNSQLLGFVSLLPLNKFV